MIFHKYRILEINTSFSNNKQPTVFIPQYRKWFIWKNCRFAKNFPCESYDEAEQSIRIHMFQYFKNGILIHEYPPRDKS